MTCAAPRSLRARRAARPRRRARWPARSLAALVLLGGCGGEPGTAEAARTTEYAVPLGTRTLVLDGTVGRVRVRTDSTATSARVWLTARARGATDRSARRRLDALVVDEARDAALHQIVWRAEEGQREGLSADLRVQLPRGASLVVHVEEGSVELLGPDGLLEVMLERGPITILDGRPLSGVAWALDTSSGDVSVGFAAGARARTAAETDAGAVRLAGQRLDHAPSGRAGVTLLGDADGAPPADVSVWTGRGDVVTTVAE